MRYELVWLSLSLSHTVGAKPQDPVRKRQIASPYSNSSTTVDTRTFGLPFTTTITTSSGPGRDAAPTQTTTTTTEPRKPPDKPTGNAITHTSDCIPGIVTFVDSVPQTVYVTIEKGYNVTATAQNASLAGLTYFETPLDTCTTTIVPKNKTQVPPQATFAPDPSSSGVYSFLIPTPTRPSNFAAEVTSTIVVTKKTPVLIVPTTPSGPPVTFQIATSSPIQQIGTGDGGSTGNTGNTGGTESVENITQKTLPVGGVGPNPTAVGSGLSGVTGTIGSVISSPFSNRTPAGGFVPAPATPTINGVPVTIGPTAIVIGGQNIALPTSSQAVVVVGSQIFTIRESEIVAPGTTFSIAGQLIAVTTITQAPSVVSTAGVTLTIGPSLAVISGTTYRIGADASAITITLNGQTLAIGSDGVVLSGTNPTTFAPAATIAGGYQIVTVSGLTVSVGPTEAVISGTTYRIGSGATTATVDVGGTAITLGPTGIVLQSTTIRPTNVPITGASISTTTARATSSGGTESSLGTALRLMRTSQALLWLTVSLPLLALLV